MPLDVMCRRSDPAVVEATPPFSPFSRPFQPFPTVFLAKSIVLNQCLSAERGNEPFKTVKTVGQYFLRHKTPLQKHLLACTMPLLAWFFCKLSVFYLQIRMAGGDWARHGHGRGDSLKLDGTVGFSGGSWWRNE